MFVGKHVEGEGCPGCHIRVSGGHAYPTYHRTGPTWHWKARCPHFTTVGNTSPSHHKPPLKPNSHQAWVNSKDALIFWILFYCPIPLCPSRAKAAMLTHDFYYVQGIAATAVLAVG